MHPVVTDEWQLWYWISTTAIGIIIIIIIIISVVASIG